MKRTLAVTVTSIIASLFNLPNVSAEESLINAGGKCLDADLLDFQANGGKVQIWDCHGNVNQQWHFDSAGRLVNGGGKCLDADLPDFQANGGKVQIWDCHGNVNQQWHFDSAGRLVNAGGKCLDAPLPELQAKGGKVQVWDCHDGLNQKWTRINASARDQVNNYFRSLPTWASKHPIVDSPPSEGTKTEVPDQVLPDETAESKRRRYVCTTTPYTLAKSPSKIVTFSPDAGKLWLGALLQGNGYVNGLGSLKELPISQRMPLVIWIDLLGTSVSRTIPDPSGATVQEAIGGLITEARSRKAPWGSSISYEKRESSSTVEFALKAGLSVKYMAADVKAKLDINQKADEKTVQAYFIQKAFTVSMVTPQTPADFFSTAFTKAALDDQVQLGRVGPENLPVYVSSITFGRILMVSITARASASDLSAILDATYEKAGNRVHLDLDVKLKKILNEAMIKVLSIGGDDAAIVGLIRSGDLYKYFDVNSELATMKPLSYQVDNMGDGSAARFTETTNYNLTECSPQPNNKEKVGEVVRVKLTHGFVHNSKLSGGSNNSCWEGLHHGAEAYGELSVNNAKVWDVSRDNHKSDVQPGTFFDIDPYHNIEAAALPSQDSQGRSIHPTDPLQENELVFLNEQGGSVRIVGQIADFQTIGGDPLNSYDQTEAYPFEYGTKRIPAGSEHCPIDLEYEIVRVRNLSIWTPDGK